MALGWVFDLIVFRAFRLLRIIRILKLARYSRSLARLGLALKIAKDDLVLALIGASIMLFVASFGIYQFENAAQPDTFTSVFDSLWWVLPTLTTVGYGDIYPVTLGDKIFTGAILMIPSVLVWHLIAQSLTIISLFKGFVEIKIALITVVLALCGFVVLWFCYRSLLLQPQ